MNDGIVKLSRSNLADVPCSDVGIIRTDTPLRLEVAARLAFPDGSITVSGLRREIARGRLAFEMIAGKQFTTLTNIAEMRELCRTPVRDLASGKSLLKQDVKPTGSSKTGGAASPQDALRNHLKTVLLKKPKNS